MLSSQRIVKNLRQTLNASSVRSVVTVFSPLTDPLEDDTIISEKKALSGEVQVTKLGNGAKIASCDHGGSVSKVVIALQAGSRFESASNLGVSHVLKNAAFTTNGDRSNLRQVREAQIMGGSLECTATRELVTRKSVALRDKLPEIMENMAPGVSSPAFKSWEMGHVIDMCKNDIAALNCAAKNSELVHSLAFRNGLGNSLYCDPVKLSNIGEDALFDFVNQMHVGNRVSVVGTNVDHDELVRYSEELLGGMPSGSQLDIPVQKYHGGEARHSTSAGLTYASLLGPVPGLTDADFPSVAVLQRLLGGPTLVKWGTNSTSSRLNKAASAATTEPFVIESLNIAYSDTGIFGIHAVSTAEAIGAVLDAAVGAAVDIGAGNLSEEDLARCKNQLKSDVLTQGSEEHLEDMLKQVMFTGNYTNLEDMLKKVDDVTVDKVVDIANKVMTNNSTYVITGDTSNAPYLDELV